MYALEWHSQARVQDFDLDGFNCWNLHAPYSGNHTNMQAYLILWLRLLTRPMYIYLKTGSLILDYTDYCFFLFPIMYLSGMLFFLVHFSLWGVLYTVR